MKESILTFTSIALIGGGPHDQGTSRDTECSSEVGRVEGLIKWCVLVGVKEVM